MVVASVALLVALGGTSYAASTLSRNSVGTVQLKNNSVTSSKVRDFSLLRQDFKPGQLPAGAAGPAGPAGPQGPAGPTARWALVRADGTILAQSGGIAPTAKPSTGAYILDFGSSVVDKLILTSSANAAFVSDRGTVSAGPCGGTPEGSTCPAGNDTNHVRVITRKAGDNTAEDAPFYIAVIG
ncbi:MAG: hypothetical protein ACXVY8_03310 [Gaiellaceae bacterium]